MAAEMKTIRVEGRTFVWNGEAHATEEEAGEKERSYRDQGFQVQRVSEAGGVLLYTRRPVSSTEAP